MQAVGAKRKARTAGNIGRQLGTVLDGRVLMAAMIRLETSSAVSIDLGTGTGQEQAHALAGRGCTRRSAKARKRSERCGGRGRARWKREPGLRYNRGVNRTHLRKD
jgi:hypothetical protein